MLLQGLDSALLVEHHRHQHRRLHVRGLPVGAHHRKASGRLPPLVARLVVGVVEVATEWGPVFARRCAGRALTVGGASAIGTGFERGWRKPAE